MIWHLVSLRYHLYDYFPLNSLETNYLGTHDLCSLTGSYLPHNYLPMTKTEVFTQVI